MWLLLLSLAVVIFVILLYVVMLVIVPGHIWFSIAAVVLILFLLVSKLGKRKSIFSPFLEAMKTFFFYVFIGLLIVGVECAVFRIVSMTDEHVIWYESLLVCCSTFLERHLSLGFFSLVVLTALTLMLV